MKQIKDEMIKLSESDPDVDATRRIMEYSVMTLANHLKSKKTPLSYTLKAYIKMIQAICRN